MSVRNYAILYGGVRKVSGGAAVGGGNALISTEQHALDGPEHTGQLPETRISTTETDTALVLRPDGTGGVVWGVDATGGTGVPITPDATVTIYVNASTGDDTTGDGTSGTPYASITRALQDIPGIVTGRYVVDVADGTYYEEVDLARFVFPRYGTSATPAYIQLDGNATTPGNCVISGASSGAPTTPIRDFCIHAGGNGYFVIGGFRLQRAAVRGLQADGYTAVNLGKMEYDNTVTGIFLGTYTVCYLLGNQTLSNLTTGIYLTEFSRLNTDSGSRVVAMTGITDRGLYVVESTLLLNTGDSLSIAAAGSGTRTAGIEADGNAVVDVPVTVSVTGAFAYSFVAVAGSRLHLKVSALTSSGYVTAAYFANDGGSVWDVDAPGYLAGSPSGGVTGFATPAIVLGSAAAAGVATTVIRSDATIVAFDGTTPDAIGTAATGSAAKAARRDHVHATGAGTPTTSAIGDAASTGSGPAAAMTDHRHGREALSTATPLVESGSGAVGTGVKSAREDHVHPAAASSVTVAAVRDVGGHWEVLMDPATTFPPVPLTTPDGTDWVWGWVSD